MAPTHILMRSLILTITFQIALLSSFAQIDDSVSLGQGYTNQSFYSLENGEVANVVNTDWDIAFMTDAFNSSVLINDNIGTALYLYSNDVSEWASVDTTGMTWTALHNSETEWERGAFISLASELDPFDYGWGAYNIVTHLVQGNKIFILELSNGTFKKVIIESLNLGTYTFKYADVDGSNEVEASANGADYDTKNFWYYSVQNGTVIDREPASDSWDLTFTRYNSEVFPGGNYVVSGALQNIGIVAAEAAGVDVDDSEWTDYAMAEEISILGADWKTFDMDIFQYVIADSLSYFVQDQGGNVWKLVFTGFGGGSTGDIDFTKEMVSATSLDEDSKVDFAVYPNPSSGQVTVVLPVDTDPVRARLLDASGRTVSQDVWSQGFQHQMDFSGIPAGIYILEMEMNGRFGHERLMIR